MRRTSAVGSLVLIVGLLSVTGPAVAETHLGHAGSIGRHHLRDSAKHPGAVCLYRHFTQQGGGIAIDGVVARPPVVFARDLTSGTDSATVGYRARLQSTDDFATWKTIDLKPIQKATATDHQRADFVAQRFNVALGTYRVLVDMLWYAADGHIVGGAASRVDFYIGKDHQGNVVANEPDYCQPGFN
jgi:hypothetical protein